MTRTRKELEDVYGAALLQQDEIRSTLDQIESFAKGPIWEDLRRQLLLWIEAGRDEMENCADMIPVAKLQGRTEAFREMMDLPAVLASAVAVEEKQEED